MRSFIVSVFGACFLSLIVGCGGEKTGNKVVMPENPAPLPKSSPTAMPAASQPSGSDDAKAGMPQRQTAPTPGALKVKSK